VTALALSAGGLWMLYLTPLYGWMQRDPLLHLAVHAHLLAAGYLFTAVVIGLDPRPHPPSRPLRAVVLVLALASHAVLAKHLYAHPPAGAPADARDGALLMYYAGACIEAALIVLFCAQWYRASGRGLTIPRRSVSLGAWRSRHRSTTSPSAER
jgi:putative membrane protein